MSDKPMTTAEVPRAVQSAVERVAKELAEPLHPQLPLSWHLTGFVMRNADAAQDAADLVAKHAGTSSPGVVLKLDPAHLIVGFVNPEALQAIKAVQR